MGVGGVCGLRSECLENDLEAGIGGGGPDAHFRYPAGQDPAPVAQRGGVTGITHVCVNRRYCRQAAGDVALPGGGRALWAVAAPGGGGRVAELLVGVKHQRALLRLRVPGGVEHGGGEVGEVAVEVDELERVGAAGGGHVACKHRGGGGVGEMGNLVEG